MVSVQFFDWKIRLNLINNLLGADTKCLPLPPRSMMRKYSIQGMIMTIHSTKMADIRKKIIRDVIKSRTRVFSCLVYAVLFHHKA